MLMLHLKLGSKPDVASRSLTPAELQKYPNSLLSSIAVASTTSDEDDDGGSSSSSTFSMDFEDAPGWPSHLMQPSKAAEVITALYR
jgi:hypothetical protein